MTPPASDLIGPSELIYWTRKGAARLALFQQHQVDELDWVQHKSIVGRIKRHIRNCAVANWRSAPVLPEVAERLRGGAVKLWLWGPTGTIW